jgi:hypothetical protein
MNTYFDTLRSLLLGWAKKNHALMRCANTSKPHARVNKSPRGSLGLFAVLNPIIAG